MQRCLLLNVLCYSLLATPALAAVKSYQVTGPVVEADDKHIIVMKGSEKWEIARDASTKVQGDPKPGAKVTIQYTMTATSVDVKPSPAGGSAKPAAATR